MPKRCSEGRSRVTASLSSIIRYFEALPNPQHHRDRPRLLVDINTISVCRVIVGCDRPTSINDWAKVKEDWLKALIELPNGIPSRDCIRRVLTALKPEVFQECFCSWIASLVSACVSGPGVIAIDGKTLRRSHDEKNLSGRFIW